MARPLVVIAAALAAACGGVEMQSAILPAGRDAERGAQLFYWMAGGFTLVWAGVIALALYAPRGRETRRAQTVLVMGGGVVFPFVVLTALLIFGLGATPAMLAPGGDDRLRLHVEGAQWWWRVRYLVEGREPIELANEIHLPANRRVNTLLTSVDVIHSFWIPPVAGKMDMIPGRLNRLALEPTRPGAYRGACAEFCGTAHAKMNVITVVHAPEAFAAWLEAQAAPAVPPATPAAQRGQTVFFQRGCMACHRIRGTAAVGTVGPDLTHVGSRQTIAAGTLPQDEAAIRRWIAEVDRIKPGAHMPTFGTLPAADLDALAAFLAGLR